METTTLTGVSRRTEVPGSGSWETTRPAATLSLNASVVPPGLRLRPASEVDTVSAFDPVNVGTA